MNKTMKAWGKLGVALSLLLIFVFLIAPGVSYLTGHDKLKAISERGIRITGIFYTDVDIYTDIDRSQGDKLRFIVKDNHHH